MRHDVADWIGIFEMKKRSKLGLDHGLRGCAQRKAASGAPIALRPTWSQPNLWMSARVLGVIPADSVAIRVVFVGL